jgi:iron complex transport system substrate-binding protein
LKINRTLIITAAALVSMAALIVFRTGNFSPGNGAMVPAAQGERPSRIISMAPSITEVLFAIGAGSQVAGVTRYCDYPPQVNDRPKVGGYLDPSYESILALQPDLIVILTEQEDPAGKMLRELGLKVIAVEHRDLDGILVSIGMIGAAAGRIHEADSLLDRLNAGMDSLRTKLDGQPRPGVLVVLGRNLAAGDLSNTYIAGADGYYNDLVELAGGANSYRGRTIAFPAVSAEGLHQLSPNVIIEVIPNLGQTGIDSRSYEQAWRELPGLDSVTGDDIHVFITDYAVRPGPRFILLARDMARAIHPEIGWQKDNRTD